MKHFTLWATVVLLGSAANVPADLRRPGLPPPVFPGNPVQIGARNAEIVVEMDNQAKEARLQIPVGLLTGGKPRLGADAGQIPTVIAGLALTCTFVSGGFWLVRRGRGRTFAAMLLGLSVAVCAASLSADIAVKPKPKKDPAETVALPAGIQISGKIVLEVVPNGNKIKLIVNKDMIKKDDKPEAKPEPKKE
jgi:hypothetical protein